LFKGYQVVAVLLNLLVWLLLIVCVALLVVMSVWWGCFSLIVGAFDEGVSSTQVQLNGKSLSAASQLTSVVVGTLSASDRSLATLFAGAGLPFTPVCAPVCLNAGSLAPVLRLADSCICGAAAIDGARAASRRGATAAAVGLAGAAALWLASCWLLVILAGHAVTAGFDRRSAAWLKEQRSQAHLFGFAAHAKDCVPLSEDDAGSAIQAVAAAAAAPRGSRDQRPRSSGV
jgi:hypothetical protein